MKNEYTKTYDCINCFSKLTVTGTLAEITFHSRICVNCEKQQDDAFITLGARFASGIRNNKPLNKVLRLKLEMLDDVKINMGYYGASIFLPYNDILINTVLRIVKEFTNKFYATWHYDEIELMLVDEFSEAYVQ